MFDVLKSIYFENNRGEFLIWIPSDLHRCE